MRHLIPRALLAAATLAVALPVARLAVADESAAKPAYSVAEGRHTYETFCMNCHGTGGQGDGYMADQLRTRPADLTRLAERHGGVYPERRVREIVDGRADVRPHGRREMPVWGDVFLWPEKESPERRAYVEEKIGELVEYLRTLQVEPEQGKSEPE